MTQWPHHLDRLRACLEALSVQDGAGRELHPEEAFSRWRDLTCTVRSRKKTVFLIGNGASASMASHVAADLAKNAYVHTQVFTDLSLITAVANDICFEEVYAEPLRRRMNESDMLVAISSSGNSVNILRAAREALALGGTLVTLSAMGANNALRTLGTFNFYIPAESYGMAETCHATILHYWIDLVALTFNGNKSEFGELSQ
jgi:D-sedoheptulose 7-phosphate isomerase